MTTSPEQPITIWAGLRTGDIGYVTYLHGILYAQEYDFDSTFDAYVALGMGEFAKDYDPDKDCIWTAEMGDRMVGSISIVGRPDNEAQLRWFIVHPDARGRGLGRSCSTNPWNSARIAASSRSTCGRSIISARRSTCTPLPGSN